MARPKSEDKKQALLEAATAAFAQSGIAASTALIARNAGVAEGTLFRYFATKDDLLNALYLHLKQDLCQTMLANLDRTITEPKEHTRNIWNSYVDWGIRNPLAHAAIRQIGVSEKLNAETEQAVKDMFRNCMNCVVVRSARCLCLTSLRPSVMQCSYRWLKPPWSLPPAIRPVPSILKRWALKPCGAGLLRKITMDSKSLQEHARRVALEIPYRTLLAVWPGV